ncbi:hypothetical protein D9V84_08105 [Bacteroidetes/Chlorobi group bacterium Naka2016]|jgi:hypothetical protein|nr:MAG: hypothetical protein D9V84_08105 [Bacteroidetes/Chlorobi group bacterium Naka2016]
MQKSIRLLVLLFTAIFFLSSCSKDDSSTNVTPSNQSYFPTTVGSYWKYLEYELDSLGVKVPGTEDTITTTLASIQPMEGKNAGIYLSTSSTNQTTDTSYYAFENDKVYSFLSLFNNEFIPVENANQWIVVADFNATEWTILKDTTLAEVDLQGVGKMTPTVSIKGRKGNKTDLVIKGKPYTAQEFIITFSMKIKLSIPNVPLPINLNFDVVQHTWYAQGVGMAKSRLDPFKISAVLFEQYMNGNQSDLIDFNIK